MRILTRHTIEVKCSQIVDSNNVLANGSSESTDFIGTSVVELSPMERVKQMLRLQDRILVLLHGTMESKVPSLGTTEVSSLQWHSLVSV